MLIPAKEYEAIYWGESQIAQQHPELIKGRYYIVMVGEAHGHTTITSVSRFDLENDQIVNVGSLGIPLRLYVLDDELSKDWALAEWPYYWPALRE